jgi:hypothetical protein
MRHRRLIIDGYSLMHNMPEIAARMDSNLAAARQRLVHFVERVAPGLCDNATIVFDGRGEGIRSAMESTSVEVIFSRPDQTADTAIERLVHDDPKPKEVLVVASDRSELETVSAAGADGMSCEQFLDHCRIQEQELVRAMKKQKSPRRGASLGDFFPDRNGTAN